MSDKAVWITARPIDRSSLDLHKRCTPLWELWLSACTREEMHCTCASPSLLSSGEHHLSKLDKSHHTDHLTSTPHIDI
jgi:hypothetical protein